MKLQDLSNAWNALRNTALGRGVKPRVSDALALRVGDEYEQWRQWLADAGTLEDMASSVSASEWVDKYRALAAEVQRELPLAYVPVLPATPFERASAAASSTLRAVGWLAGVAIVVAGAAFVATRRGGRR